MGSYVAFDVSLRSTRGRFGIRVKSSHKAFGTPASRPIPGWCGSALYSLIVTAKLNDADPRAWLADVLRRINDHPASRLHELLPWN